MGSLERVRAALAAAGATVDVREMQAETRTAEQAAQAAGCALDQIVKSILFAGPSGLWLFLAPGGRQVDAAQASALAQEPLGRADPAEVRRVTGFAIGGVAPVGHLAPVPVFIDPVLLTFGVVWAAAGTPRHIFSIAPHDLVRISAAKVAPFTDPAEKRPM